MGRRTRLKKYIPEIRMEVEIGDPFFDNGAQELFVCHDMIDKSRVMPGKQVTITVDKDFLLKMLYSHIYALRKV